MREPTGLLSVKVCFVFSDYCLHTLILSRSHFLFIYLFICLSIKSQIPFSLFFFLAMIFPHGWPRSQVLPALSPWYLPPTISYSYAIWNYQDAVSSPLFELCPKVFPRPLMPQIGPVNIVLLQQFPRNPLSIIWFFSYVILWEEGEGVESFSYHCLFFKIHTHSTCSFLPSLLHLFPLGPVFLKTIILEWVCVRDHEPGRRRLYGSGVGKVTQISSRRGQTLGVEVVTERMGSHETWGKCQSQRSIC